MLKKYCSPESVNCKTLFFFVNLFQYLENKRQDDWIFLNKLILFSSYKKIATQPHQTENYLSIHFELLILHLAQLL